MQIRNIRPFSQYVPGDVVEVPDGAAFDDFHWEAVPVADLPDITGEPESPAAPPARPPAPFAPVTVEPDPPKEM